MAMALSALPVSGAKADCAAPPISNANDLLVSFLRTNGTQAAPASLFPSAQKEGMLVYDSAADKLKLCDGTNWVAVGNTASQWIDVTGGINYPGGKVGIGTITPQSALHVAGGIQLGDDTATCPGSSNIKLGTMRFNTGALQLCGASGWGAVSQSSNEVSFSANSGASVLANNTWVEIANWTQATDIGGDNFNPVSGRFTAPVTGTYQFNATLYIPYNVSALIVQTEAVGAGGSQICYSLPTLSGSPQALTCSGSVYLTAGTAVELIGNQASGSSQTLPATPRTSFSGYLINGGGSTGSGGGGSAVSPSFHVNKAGTNQTVSASESVITWPNDSAIPAFDSNSNFSSNRFTPTVSGRYLITLNTYVVSGTHQPKIYKNSTLVAEGYNSSANSIVPLSVIVEMNGTTDFIEARIHAVSGTTLEGLIYHTNMSGSLLGGSTSGGTPASPANSVQFNNAGAFGGDAALTWDNVNKRLGIGTATPLRPLHIAGSASVLRMDREGTDGAVIYLNRTASSTLQGGVALTGDETGLTVAYDADASGANTPLVKVTSSGNVGIGTSSPATSLHVHGTQILNSGSTAPGLSIVPTSGSSYVFGANTVISGAGLYDTTGGTWRIMAKDVTGYVGIGTITPQSQLQVAGGIQLGDDTATCPGASNIKLGTLRFNSGALQLCISTGWGSVASNSGTAPSFFAHRNGVNHTGITSGAATLMTLGTEAFDVGNSFNGTKFQPQVAGKYVLSGNASFTGGNISGYCWSEIRKNGTPFTHHQTNVDAFNNCYSTSSVTVEMNGSSDYAELYVAAASSGAATISGSMERTNFSGSLLGGGAGGGGSASATGSTGQVQFNGGSSSFAADAALHWDNTNKRLGIGTAAPLGPLTIVASGTTGGEDDDLSLRSYSATDPNGAPGVTLLRARGSSGTPLTALAGDGLGNLWFGGHNGTIINNYTANIGAVAETNFNTSLATALTFTTNGGSGNGERMRLTGIGFLGIGTTAPTSKVTISANTTALPTPQAGTLLHIGSADATNNILTLDAFGAATNLNFRASSGTAAAPTTVLNGGGLGNIVWQGRGGTSYITNSGAKINAVADEDWTDTSAATSLVFSTRSAGNVLPSVERMRITGAGNVAIGITWASNRLSVLPSSATNYWTGSTYAAKFLSFGNTAKGVTIGYDDSVDAGIIAVEHAGTSWRNLLLNPSAGNIGVGTTAPSYLLDVQRNGNGTAGSTGILNLKFTAATNTQALQITQTNAGGDGLAASALFKIANAGSNPYANFDNKFFISQTGYVGIGTTSPSSPLSVGSSTSGGAISLGATDNALEGAQIDWAGASTYPGWSTDVYINTFRIFNSSASNSRVDMFNNGAGETGLYVEGNVGIGTQAPSYKLHVSGIVAGAGAYVNTSDGRLKKDVHDLEYGLDAVMKLRPVSFLWKAQQEDWQRGRKLGLIAQEVEAVVPESVAVANDAMKTKSIAYGDLTPILIKAIQELKAANDNQATQIEMLRKEVDQLKAVR